MRNKKIMLVDDEESILHSSRINFEHEGYEVTTAMSGEEGITCLQNNHFDMVISDLVMPGVDGIVVLQEAKKQNPDVCMIILTGYGDMYSAIEALRLGADDYLLKPCDSEELLLRTKRCLDKQEAVRKVKLYESILPVCMYCKSIRDDAGAEHGKGAWVEVDEYLYRKSQTNISHSCCPDCYEVHHKDMEKY